MDGKLNNKKVDKKDKNQTKKVDKKDKNQTKKVDKKDKNQTKKVGKKDKKAVETRNNKEIKIKQNDEIQKISKAEEKDVEIEEEEKEVKKKKKIRVNLEELLEKITVDTVKDAIVEHKWLVAKTIAMHIIGTETFEILAEEDKQIIIKKINDIKMKEAHAFKSNII